MMNYISLGFILYNPAIASIKRIVDAADSGYEVFVILNSRLDEDLLLPLKSNDRIHILVNKTNEGLARGLSSVCSAASEQNHKALLYFDQDSIFTRETIDYVARYFYCVLTKPEEFIQSIVSTTFRDTTTLNRRYNYISSFRLSEFLIENVYFTINSGSLYFLDKIKYYNWFDVKYFVDGVDYSFCINSIRNNFKITEIYNTPGLDHEKEQGNLQIKLFNKLRSGRVYPFNRNIDFIKSHLIILFNTFKIRSLKPKIFIIKSICVYIVLQLIFRIKSK